MASKKHHRKKVWWWWWWWWWWWRRRRRGPRRRRSNYTIQRRLRLVPSFTMKGWRRVDVLSTELFVILSSTTLAVSLISMSVHSLMSSVHHTRCQPRLLYCLTCTLESLPLQRDHDIPSLTTSSFPEVIFWPLVVLIAIHLCYVLATKSPIFANDWHNYISDGNAGVLRSKVLGTVEHSSSKICC